MSRATSYLCASLAALFVGAVAVGEQIRLTMSSIVLDAGGSFDGVTHSGMLQLSMDADSALSLFQFGTGENLLSGNPLTGLSGYLFLSNGMVTGGSLSTLP